MTVDTSQYVPDFLIKINGTDFRHGTNIDVLSVSITETINRSDSFQFQLRGRHPKLEHFPSGGELKWIDDDKFDPGNKVEIEMGYRKNRALKLIGKITAITVNFPASGVPTLSVQGQGLFDDLTRKHRRKPFASKNDTEIVKEIAGIFGLTADVGNLNTEHETVSFNDKTYADILKERADRLNFEVAVKQKTLIFKRPVYLENKSSQLTLEWGRSLLSFSPRLSTSSMPTKAEQRSSQTAQGGEKAPIVATVTAAQVPARLADKSGPQYVREWFGENEVLSGESRAESPKEAEDNARAKLERAALEFVKATAAANGNPQIVSRTVIELKGLGKRFSGNYYVTSTTHKIDGSGYQTTFEAKRDGL